mgnify:CR=1 FL=1
MIPPNNNARFIQQLFFCQKGFIPGFVQPIGMITVIPEQRFMTDDQIGAAGTGLADDVDGCIFCMTSLIFITNLLFVL